ncbi:MAG: phosphorylase family protein [Motilibacteraceae bacterium]
MEGRAGGLDRRGWLDLLGLAEDEVPQVLVVEGSWWRREREAQRLALLTDVRELGAPDWWWGRYGESPVVYACLYGGARAVEPVDVLGLLGTPLVAQVGSCGGLAGQRPGDVVVPDRVTVAEGASLAYGAGPVVDADPGLVAAVADLGRARGLAVQVGPHVTHEVLLHQPPAMVAGWAAAGHLGVDMETSAVLAVARARGMRAVAALHVWDDLLAQRSWADPLPADEEGRRRAAEQALVPLMLDALLNQMLPDEMLPQTSGSVAATAELVPGIAISQNRR